MMREKTAAESNAAAEKSAPPSGQRRFVKLRRRIWENRTYYIMFLPCFVLLIIFAYVPMYGIILAFKDFNPFAGIIGSPWAGDGLDNFREIFSNPYFWRAFRNTLIINGLKLCFCFPAPIILAIMINAVSRSWLRRSIQTIVYLPHFISWVVISSLVFSLFDSDSGLLSAFLSLFGMSRNVLGNGPFFVALLVLSDIWKEAGWGTIIYLAALSGISPEYYEAAEIDGANKVQQFRFITLPCLMPTICIMLILQVGGLVSGGFDQVYNLYNTTVYEYVDIIDTFIYRYGISDGQYALGTAIGLFSNVINITLVLGTNFIVRKLGGESLY